MARKTPEELMRRAIELSRCGFPAPNPHVGCVIAKDGEVVGEGFHSYAGGPHAEVVALDQAGDKARNADVYVTLEPCNHQGRSGPCSLALIGAEVDSVTFSVADPNPKAHGGREALEHAGVAVKSGLLAEEASAANYIWLKAMRLQRPFVNLKAAITLDGKIALPSGESKWITGPESRKQAHMLRAEMGAVLVGANTARADNPKLTARLEGLVNQPVRVVLDPGADLEADLAMFQEPGIFYRIVPSALQTRANDVAVAAKGGTFEIDAVLRALWERGITSLLVEGGAATLGSFLKAKLFDRIDLFVAPKILGQGLSWPGGYSIERLTEIHHLEMVHSIRLGDDIWLRLESGSG